MLARRAKRLSAPLAAARVAYTPALLAVLIVLVAQQAAWAVYTPAQEAAWALTVALLVSPCRESSLPRV